MHSRRLTQLSFLFPLLAFWPVWIWYFRRTGDGSAEPWQLLAVLGILFFAATRQLGSPKSVFLVCCGLLLYLATYTSIPPLGRAGIAFLTLLLATSSPKDTPPGIFLLLFLALPIFSTLDFLLSYPLRQVTAYLSLPLLQSAGFEVSVLGNSFLWNTKTVLIDAPCSGIRMVYTSMLLTAFLSSTRELRWRETIALSLSTLLVIILANVSRSASLFFLEARPFQEALLERYESPLHTSAGIFVFLCSAITICGIASFLGKQSQLSPKIQEKIAFRALPSSRLSLALVVLLSLTAAARPLVADSSKRGRGIGPESTVPLAQLASSLISENELKEVALSQRDATFAMDFPGRIQRFRGPSSELLVRSVTSATRSLHPAADCFRGLGYTIHPLPSERDGQGNLWGCFEARSKGQDLNVCEHIVSANNRHWSDISSWFWSATFHPESGPWNALTKLTLHTDFTQASS